jgi:hypothetical protein
VASFLQNRRIRRIGFVAQTLLFRNARSAKNAFSSPALSDFSQIRPWLRSEKGQETIQIKIRLIRLHL